MIMSDAVKKDLKNVSNSNGMVGGLKLTDRATLSLLSTLEDGENLSQRSLAMRIGVALGLTNSLLRRAIRKGLVKVKQAPAKRYAYYITPKGFIEKGHLVSEYLFTSLTFFRQVREEYSTLFAQISNDSHKRIALFGVSELAEIALLSARSDGVDIFAMIQPGSNHTDFSGLPVINSLDAAHLQDIDAVVITSTEKPQEAYDSLVDRFGVKRVFSVPLQHVSENVNVRREK
jgi:DNA-binding MarR family transcriptional regulator